MYAKDKLGIDGFIQEGASDDRSYYYSLPRVEIVGRITYTGKGGIRRTIDVTGQGWVDRQVGRLPDQVLGVVIAALLQRRPGQSVQLRQRLPGRDLPEGRRLHAMAGGPSPAPAR